MVERTYDHATARIKIMDVARVRIKTSQSSHLFWVWKEIRKCKKCVSEQCQSFARIQWCSDAKKKQDQRRERRKGGVRGSATSVQGGDDCNFDGKPD